MNDDDLLDMLERIAARLDRIEVEQARINAALYAVGEAAILTYRATGTKEGLPDEVIDAPVMEQAIMRAPLAMPVRLDVKDTERLAAIVAKGAAAMDAEIKVLQQQARGVASLAERIRIGHRVHYLDQAMKRSFAQHQRAQAREQERSR